MLCVKLKSYDRACGATSGGVSRIFIFDPNDFDFTQTEATEGVLPGYSALALRTGAVQADGAQMFPIDFQYEEAEYKYTQSIGSNGCSVKYEHEVDFTMIQLGQLITQWNQAIDAAGCCCGVGLIVELNDGTVIVLGEKYVNGVAIPRWIMRQDGSTGTSGKLFDDANAQNTIIKGDYTRPAHTFTGGIETIEAFVGNGSV